MIKNILAIGVDVGGTHISSVAFDMDKLALLSTTKSSSSVNNKADATTIIATWAKTINATIEKTGTNRIEGIGFAMPGAFDYLNGIAMFKGNAKYESLFNVNVKDGIKELLPLPTSVPIRFMNDATAFAVGNCWVGEARKYNKVIALTLGTGFGSAFLEGGIPVIAEGKVPKEGCLWHLPHLDGIADDYFSTRWFLNEYENQTEERLSGVKQIAELAEKGDSIAKGLFSVFGEQMALFLLPWVNKFDAECIVIGGNISKALDLFLPALRTGLDNSNKAVQLLPSTMMEDAAISGAARLTDPAFWAEMIKVTPSL